MQLFISPHLIKEVLKKLNEFKASEASITKTMTVLEAGELVTPSIKITVCLDPKDNFICTEEKLGQSDKAKMKGF